MDESIQEESTMLVSRWQAGDDDAATELYERYFERLIRIVSGNLLNRYQSHIEPEDVLLSAFRTVFTRLQNGQFRFEDDEDIWKLLVTVSLNKLRRHVRHLNADRRDVRRQVSQSSSFDDFLAVQLSQSPGVGEAVEFADLLRKTLSILPEDERAVLQLRMEGLSQQEIAERLGVTDRTVRRMMDRIRGRLGMLFDNVA